MSGSHRDPSYPVIAAVVRPYGPGWVPLTSPEAKADVTLQLVTDDVPIEGRVLGLEGHPVPGATVTTDENFATHDEDLTPVIKSGMLNGVQGKWKCLAASIAGLTQTLATDREGRFRRAGIGRERVVFLGISGPTIQSGRIRVIARPEFQASPTRFERPKLPLADSPSMGVGPMVYPARFEHAVGPTKPIEGVVRDGATPTIATARPRMASKWSTSKLAHVSKRRRTVVNPA
jgi:hypothetical protein